MRLDSNEAASVYENETIKEISETKNTSPKRTIEKVDGYSNSNCNTKTAPFKTKPSESYAKRFGYFRFLFAIWPFKGNHRSLSLCSVCVCMFFSSYSAVWASLSNWLLFHHRCYFVFSYSSDSVIFATVKQIYIFFILLLVFFSCRMIIY